MWSISMYARDRPHLMHCPYLKDKISSDVHFLISPSKWPINVENLLSSIDFNTCLILNHPHPFLMYLYSFNYFNNNANTVKFLPLPVPNSTFFLFCNSWIHCTKIQKVSETGVCLFASPQWSIGRLYQIYFLLQTS